jgi:ABC-type glycerol-3-phosphate transport system substrate-binding protein
MRRLIPIILLLVFLTACRDAPGPEAVDTAPAVTQTEQVTITLAVEGTSLNRYRPLIDAFEEENPHIRVRLVNTGEVADPDESGIRALATSFDVFPYSPNRQGESQYLLDLRPLLDLDPQFDTADFLPGLLPPATEPLWAIPTGAAYYLTFYDQSAFEAANLLPPELDWTTDDFLAAALTLTVREGDDVTRWGYVPGQLRYPPLLASQLAGPLTTPDGSLRLADPDVVTAVQWLSDLFTVHEVSPWLEEYKPAGRQSGGGGQSALALIDSGMAAMWHTTHLLFDADKENVGVTAVPHGPHGVAAEPIVYGFGISRGTAHPEAAWQLLHFLSRQPPQEAMFSVGPVPARRSVAAANSYWQQVPDSLAPALQYTAENSTPPRITYQAADLLQETFVAHIEDGVLLVEAMEQHSINATTPAEPSDTEIIIVETVESETSTDDVQIVFRTWTGMTEAHRLLVNQFQRQNPTIQIQIVERDERGGSPLNRVASSDCFVGFSHDLADNEFRTALLPLEPLLDLDTTLDIEAFYLRLFSQLVVDGQVLGLPAGVVIPYIDYNRRLFQEAGIPEPSFEWTLAEFLQIAQQLTSGEGESKQYGYANLSAYSFLIRGVDLFHVQLMDNSEAVPRFDYEAAAEMITWYADLARLHEVQPVMTNDHVQNFAQYDSLIREERVAMWPGGGADYLAAMGQPYPTLDIGVAPEPLGPGGHKVRYWVDAYYISANSTNQAACWEWIKFLAMEPSAPRLPLLPGHIETAESTEYRDIVGADLAAIGHAFISTPSTESIPSLPPWMGPGFDWLISTYIIVVNGQSDVMSALAEADAKFSQYRQCVIERDGFDDPAAWSACAAEAER